MVNFHIRIIVVLVGAFGKYVYAMPHEAKRANSRERLPPFAVTGMCKNPSVEKLHPSRDGSETPVSVWLWGKLGYG